jgi:hypothetical protein
VTASRLVSVVASAFALAGCENPAGQTERFLTQGMKGVEEQERGKVPPLPSFRPREVPPLVIERDPFKRR